MTPKHAIATAAPVLTASVSIGIANPIVRPGR
jgi:hypothetical protein